MANAVPSTLFDVVVTLDAPTPGVDWGISGGPENVGVIVLEASTADDTVFDLFIAGLLPGQTYTITATTEVVVEVALTIPTTAPFIDYGLFPLPYPAKLLEAFTFAMGKEAQHTNGTSCTHLLGNYTKLGTSFFVKSTLGFPASGTIRVENRLFYYTSKTPTSFDGLTGDYIYFNLPKGSRVFLVTKDILPPRVVAGIPPIY